MLSIITVTHNAAGLLPETLHSLLAGSREVAAGGFESIFIDAESSDSTVSLIGRGL